MNQPEPSAEVIEAAQRAEDAARERLELWLKTFIHPDELADAAIRDYRVAVEARAALNAAGAAWREALSNEIPQSEGGSQ